MLEHADDSDDQCLVNHCLALEPAAWVRLNGYRRDLERYAHWLQGGRAILGYSPEGTVQQVFFRLCNEDHGLLRGYTPERGSLLAYLRGLVRRQIRALREQARRRVRTVPLADYDRIDPGASGGLAEAELHECVATLGLAEQQFLTEEMRPRPSSEQRLPALARVRKARQRLWVKIRGKLG